VEAHAAKLPDVCDETRLLLWQVCVRIFATRPWAVACRVLAVCLSSSIFQYEVTELLAKGAPPPQVLPALGDTILEVYPRTLAARAGSLLRSAARALREADPMAAYNSLQRAHHYLVLLHDNTVRASWAVLRVLMAHQPVVLLTLAQLPSAALQAALQPPQLWTSVSNWCLHHTRYVRWPPGAGIWSLPACSYPIACPPAQPPLLVAAAVAAVAAARQQRLARLVAAAPAVPSTPAVPQAVGAPDQASHRAGGLEEGEIPPTSGAYTPFITFASVF
jgi:hypothetical protein